MNKQRDSFHRLLVIAFGVPLLCFSFLSSWQTASAAPAPKKKPAPVRPALEGFWSMNWNGTSAPTEFRKNGVFWCYWAQQEWMGTWQLKGNVLTVSETPNIFDAAPSYFTWTVKLVPGKWTSTDDNRPTFKLSPHAPKGYD